MNEGAKELQDVNLSEGTATQMMQTSESELRAESEQIAARRSDAIRVAGTQMVTATIEDTLDTYGTTESFARAVCWGWIESAASRCDWDTVRTVIAAFRARYPK